MTFSLAMVPLAASQASAQAGSTTEPAVTIGGVLFYDYRVTTAPEGTDEAGHPIHDNGFHVTRAYLDVRGRLSPLLSLRITPDIAGPTDDGFTFRLKYGYAQLDLERFTGPWTGTRVRAGIQPTPFLEGADRIYRYRFQGTSFAERDGGLSSADTGLSARTELPSGYGEVHAGIYNGEGYKEPEANDQKALMVRATFRPFPGAGAIARGLLLTAYVHRDHVMHDAERHRLIGSLWYEHARFNAGFDYLTRDDRTHPGARLIESDGLSFFVTPFLATRGDGAELLVRYDTFRPDRTAGDGRHHRLITGLAWWWPLDGDRATALMVDLEQVSYRGAGETRETERRLFVHGLVDF